MALSSPYYASKAAAEAASTFPTALFSAAREFVGKSTGNAEATETLTVPASPYKVQLGIPLDQADITATVGGVSRTIVRGDSAASGQIAINYNTGVWTFAAADTGGSASITFTTYASVLDPGWLHYLQAALLDTQEEVKNNKATGPASATDNAVARFDGTTGKLLQNSVVTIGDTGAVAGVTTLAASGVITSTVSTGTAPFTVASTTVVTNLNADQLDGADWAAPAAIGSGTPAAGSFTTLSATSTVTGSNIKRGTGSPESAVTGVVGDVYQRTDGSTGTTIYYKASGTGNTGWVAVAPGVGDVVGPGSSTDNAIVRFDSTTGKLVQNSSATVDDSGNLNAANFRYTTTSMWIGDLAGSITDTGTNSVHLGRRAGASGTSTSDNVVVGVDAGRTNTVGTGNTLVGYRAGELLTGSGNVMIGDRVGASATSMNASVLIGTQAGFLASNGVANVAIGENAGFRLSTGADNVLVGSDAGADATKGITTGSQNTAIGNNSGFSFSDTGKTTSVDQTGSYNTALGQETGWYGTSATYQTVIGAGSMATADNQIMLGRLAGTDSVVAPGLFTAANLTRRAGTPESNTTATVGAIAQDTTNGEAYIKNTGTGNTGWKRLARAEEITGGSASDISTPADAASIGLPSSPSDGDIYTIINLDGDADNIDVGAGSGKKIQIDGTIADADSSEVFRTGTQYARLVLVYKASSSTWFAIVGNTTDWSVVTI